MLRDGRPLPVNTGEVWENKRWPLKANGNQSRPSFSSIVLVMGRGWTLWWWRHLLLSHEIGTRRKSTVTCCVLSVSLCCILKSRRQNNAGLVRKIPFASVFLRIMCLSPVSDFPRDGVKRLHPLLLLLASLFGKRTPQEISSLWLWHKLHVPC